MSPTDPTDHVDHLDLDDVLAAAVAVLGAPPEVRDWGLLDAAVKRPGSVAFGEDAFPGLHDKAAALFDSLVRYHALNEGNKRLSWVATRLFYVLNGRDLRAPGVDDGERLVLSVISGAVNLASLAETLAAWSAELR